VGEFGGGEIGGGGREGVSRGLELLSVSEKELCCSSLQEERTLFISNNSLSMRGLLYEKVVGWQVLR
jgi:hypothetical protein